MRLHIIYTRPSAQDYPRREGVIAQYDTSVAEMTLDIKNAELQDPSRSIWFDPVLIAVVQLPDWCRRGCGSCSCDMRHPQNCGGLAGSAAELMPSHITLLTVTLPWASSLTVQMVS